MTKGFCRILHPHRLTLELGRFQYKAWLQEEKSSWGKRRESAENKQRSGWSGKIRPRMRMG